MNSKTIKITYTKQKFCKNMYSCLKKIILLCHFFKLGKGSLRQVLTKNQYYYG